MAFNTAVSSATSQPASDSWKAQAFLNFYLPRSNGEGRHKIGAIPLKDARNYDAQLIKRLSEDPEAIAKLLDLLEVDFQLVNDPKAPANALPF